MPSITPSRQTPSSTPATPSPSTDYTDNPSTLTMTSVDVTYQIVQIKPTDADWVTPSPTDYIHIVGPVFRHNPHIRNDEEAASIDEDFEIPCAAYLVWGDRSIDLTCRYCPPAALFTHFGECEDETANATGSEDSVKSAGISMRDADFCGEEITGAMTLDEDMRDDNGIPFLVLHVREELCGSVRLYCKRVVNR